MRVTLVRINDCGTTATLLTADLLELHVPLALLPPHSTVGSIVTVAFQRDTQAESERGEALKQLQQTVLAQSRSALLARLNLTAVENTTTTTITTTTSAPSTPAQVRECMLMAGIFTHHQTASQRVPSQ